MSIGVFYKHAVCHQGLYVICLLYACRGSCSRCQKACQGGTWMDWQLEEQTVKEANWNVVLCLWGHAPQLRRKFAFLTPALKLKSSDQEAPQHSSRASTGVRLECLGLSNTVAVFWTVYNLLPCTAFLLSLFCLGHLHVEQPKRVWPVLNTGDCDRLNSFCQT